MLTAVACAVVIGTAPSIARAENPLYCDNYYHINEGCNGPFEVQTVNETRNENGGCIAAQWYLENEEGEGYYSAVKEACEGRDIIYTITAPTYSFPRCWNRTEAYDLIHCRHN
jgi:hypothetical protein